MNEQAEPSKVYVDTNIIICAFEGSDEVSRPLEVLFDLFSRHPGSALTSELTWAEILGKESPRGWAWQTRFYLDFFVHSGVVELPPVSRGILEETGSYRRSLREMGRSTNLPDAIHIVTAVRGGCRYVLSSDSRLIVPHPLERIIPNGTGLARLQKVLDA